MDTYRNKKTIEAREYVPGECLEYIIVPYDLLDLDSNEPLPPGKIYNVEYNGYGRQIAHYITNEEFFKKFEPTDTGVQITELW